MAVNAYYNALVVKSNSDANYLHKLREALYSEFESSELKYIVLLILKFLFYFYVYKLFKFIAVFKIMTFSKKVSFFLEFSHYGNVVAQSIILYTWPPTSSSW